MNKVIWKYELPPSDYYTLHMPKNAKILFIAMQRGAITKEECPCMWVLVDPDGEKEMRNFVTVGTGHIHEDGFWKKLNYIGSYMLYDDKFVGHVFEEV